ncbi:MAG: hypothetical protein MJA84_09330, partial [Firmicutes bacterium]|nr:hypothetical protein [Bacillota bacterium]
MDSSEESVFQIDLSTIGTDVSLNDSFASSAVTSVGRAYSVQVSIEVKQAADTVRAQFTGVENISVGTAGGEDTVTLFNAPSSEVTSLSIRTGDEGDTIELQDLSATTLIEAGDGDDTVSLRTQSDGTVTIEGDAGEDFIELIEVGANAITVIRGGGDNDLIQIAGDELASTTSTTVDGKAPSNVTTGDTLLFSPGDPSSPVTQTGAVPAGSVGVTAMGVVNFSDIEELQVIAAPTMTFPNGTLIQIKEGDALNASVTLGTGSHNVLDGTVLWDIDGDGEFGDETGSSITISWDRLKNTYGIDNGFLERKIAVRATNTNGYTTTKPLTVQVANVAPVVSVSGDAQTTVGADYGISFSASDPADDALENWLVNWGDGSLHDAFGIPLSEATNLDAGTLSQAVRDLFIANGRELPTTITVTVDVTGSEWSLSDGSTTWELISDGAEIRAFTPEQTFGSGVTSAIHNYATPGTYTVSVSVIDEDSTPAIAASQTLAVSVTVAANSATTDGPYEIKEGEALSLSATAVSTPTS